jgi:cysteinyl-tRNA synthetase
MVFTDLLVRYLEYRGLTVRHVMNITDLDDRTIEGSARAGQSLADFTGGHIEAFLRDLALLNIRPAAALPRASEHLEEMVALAEKLVQSGHAYEKLRSLYFNIGKASGYGRLSGVDLDKIRLGATVDLEDYEKDNPRDFTLLKRCRLAELKRGLYVKTRWGSVRPSWHLQCAAMAMKFLGAHFDIHLSGRELIFPHHENEIAIATALTGNPLARFWVHCDGVRLEEGKAAGGESAIDLEAMTAGGWSGSEIRFWLLSTHYHKPVRYSPEQLAEARRSLSRINTTIVALQQVTAGSAAVAETDQLIYDLRTGFTSAMDEDLNIATALACLFRCLRQVNRHLQQARIDASGAARILEALRAVDAVLGVMDFNATTADAAVQDLLQRRTEARRQHDWELADRLREELLARGVTPRDEKCA